MMISRIIPPRSKLPCLVFALGWVRTEVIAVIELGSYTMRGGEHAGRLSEAVREADQVIWFQPRDVAFDIQAVVQETSANLVHSADALLALLTPQFDAQVEATHLVLMSNYQLDGFRELITERYG